MAAVAVGAAGSLAGETLPRVCRSHREGSGDNSHWPPPPGAARPAAGGGRSRGGGGAGEGRSQGGGGAGIPARSPPRMPRGQASVEPAPRGGCNPAAGFGDWPRGAAAPR